MSCWIEREKPFSCFSIGFASYALLKRLMGMQNFWSGGGPKESDLVEIGRRVFVTCWIERSIFCLCMKNIEDFLLFFV